MANTYNYANTVSIPNTSTYTMTSGGTAGQVLTTNGTGGSYWTNTTSVPSFTVADNVLKVSGNPASLEVKGSVVINGQDLEERLKTIEKVLMIPERDVILETAYPLLKKKYDDYINTLSKYRMWESIKGEKDGK